jgi:uncharacterized RDD family membrane protein YckC
MSVIRINTIFNIELEFTAASFHRRLAAWLLDVVVLLFYCFFGFKTLEFISVNTVNGKGENIWAIIMIFILPVLTYHLVCEVFMHGQSVGKRIMGLQVVNENGGSPSLSQYIIRWLIRTSDYMIVVIALYAPAAASSNPQFFWQVAAAFCLLLTDIILVNSSKKNQRLGDMLAHTMLINKNQTADLHDTIFLPLKENYTPAFPQVMSLSDKDINALKGILDSAKKYNDYTLAERAADKIKAHLHIETDIPDFDFLEILLKDYNYLSAN